MSAQVGVTSPRTKSSSSGGSSGSAGVKVHSSGESSAGAVGLHYTTRGCDNQSIKFILKNDDLKCQQIALGQVFDILKVAHLSGCIVSIFFNILYMRTILRVVKPSIHFLPLFWSLSQQRHPDFPFPRHLLKTSSQAG